MKPQYNLPELKEKLQEISAKIGMIEVRRSVGIHESIIEYNNLRNEFGRLSKTYMKMKKREMEKNIDSFKEINEVRMPIIFNRIYEILSPVIFEK